MLVESIDLGDLGLMVHSLGVGGVARSLIPRRKKLHLLKDKSSSFPSRRSPKTGSVNLKWSRVSSDQFGDFPDYDHSQKQSKPPTGIKGVCLSLKRVSQDWVIFRYLLSARQLESIACLPWK